MRVLTHREYDLTSLLEIFLNVLKSNMSILKEKKFNTIDDQYHKHLFNHNKWSLYKDKDIVFKAKLRSVNKLGLLELDLENGTSRSYDFQKVSQLI
jgi:biotin-(acetyl-CoA carboxylase) ligase